MRLTVRKIRGIKIVRIRSRLITAVLFETKAFQISEFKSSAAQANFQSQLTSDSEVLNPNILKFTLNG